MPLIKGIIRGVWVKGILKYKPLVLRLFGAKIGKNCTIYTSLRNFDKYYTHLIEIGDNVTITKNVILLCHDISKGEQKTGRIEIGDNSFIGINSIILPNVIIGKNVIIGAGSIVVKNIPDDVTAAGNPAKVINSRKKR